MLAHAHEVHEDHESDDSDEEGYDPTMPLTRDESRTLFDRVAAMHQKWDAMELGIATALSNDKSQAARLDRLDGRTAKVEDRVVTIEHTIGRHKRQSDSAELDDLERTQNGVRVKIPIQRASEMIAAEKNEGELKELLARYMWWKGTVRDVAVGAAKLAGKFVLTGALGWLGHTAYLYFRTH